MTNSSKITLQLEAREVTGKKVASLRKQGLVPTVVYGSGLEPVIGVAPAGVIEKVYSQAGKHHPVHITVDGKSRIAMIKTADFDPVKRTLRHVAFHAVKQNEKVTAEIPVVLVGEGESAAEKAGLVVLQTIEVLEVQALPMDLPDKIEVQIIDLAEPGEHVGIADVKLPQGVEFTHPEELENLVIASVYEPSALQAANEAAGGDAEPGDEAEIEADNGEDTDQASQAGEDQPGGKGQEEPKES